MVTRSSRRKPELTHNPPVAEQGPQGSNRGALEAARPEGWQPPAGDRLVDLHVSVGASDPSGPRPPCTLWIASVHRTPKAQHPHTQRRSAASDPTDAAVFTDVPPGHHLVVAQFSGFRPYAWLIDVTSTRTRVELPAPPLLPVRSELEERVLVRAGEAHPHIRHVRGFMGRFGYIHEAVRAMGVATSHPPSPTTVHSTTAWGWRCDSSRSGGDSRSPGP